MAAKRTAEQIVDAVAEAAHGLFVERSPSAVSIREIAAAADVNLGLIHRYVGSKDDVIALVLARHTARTQVVLDDAEPNELLRQVAQAVVRRPATGRLIGGMILDGVDVAELKDEFPLLRQMAEHGRGVEASIVYALALGWELFGPSLLTAAGDEPDPDDLVDALATALAAIATGAVDTDPA